MATEISSVDFLFNQISIEIITPVVTSGCDIAKSLGLSPGGRRVGFPAIVKRSSAGIGKPVRADSLVRNDVEGKRPSSWALAEGVRASPEIRARADDEPSNSFFTILRDTKPTDNDLLCNHRARSAAKNEAT